MTLLLLCTQMNSSISLSLITQTLPYHPTNQQKLMQAYSICLFLASPFVGTEKQGCARNAIPLRLKNKKPNRIRVEHPHKNFSTSSSPLCSLRLTFPRSSQRQLLAEGQHHGDEPIKVFSIIFAQAFALKRDEGGLFSLFCDYLGKIKPKDRREGLKLYSRGDEILSLKAGDQGGRKTGQLSKLRMVRPSLFRRAATV